MNYSRVRITVMMLGVSLAVHAQSTTDLRGIYVSGTDFPVSKEVATSLAAALKVPGVDGLLLGIAWDSLEPGMGEYDWSTLDQMDEHGGLARQEGQTFAPGPQPSSMAVSARAGWRGRQTAELQLRTPRRAKRVLFGDHCGSV